MTAHEGRRGMVVVGLSAVGLVVARNARESELGEMACPCVNAGMGLGHMAWTG